MKKFNKFDEELNKDIPNVCNDVKNSVNWNQIKELNEINEKKPKFNPSFKLKTAILSFCLILVVGLSVGLPFIFKDTNTIKYNMFIDVNPTIKLTVDKNDIITKQSALNEDAVIFLYKQNYVGQNIDIATRNILKAMQDDGFIKDTIKISIKDTKGKVLFNEQNDITKAIKDYINNDAINIDTLNDIDIDNIEDYYENHHVGEYEKSFIEKFKTELLTVVNIKISKIDNLILHLTPNTVENANLYKAEIKEFCDYYMFKNSLNKNDIDNDDVKDFVKELAEHKQDLQDSLKDINDSDDDYGEILEDMFEIVKDELFKQDD